MNTKAPVRPMGQSPDQNHLLAALPPEEFARLAPCLEPVALRLGDFLYGPDEQLRHAYFPTTAIVSLHYVTESGASAETAGVGNEGVVGIPLFLGGNTTSSSAVVQTAGFGYRLEAHLLKEEFDRGGFVQKLLLRYTQALMTQMSQTAACNRHHAIEQQLCRWLLLTLDRSPTSELIITQELVANMLGVRREGDHRGGGEAPGRGLHKVPPGPSHGLEAGGPGDTRVRVLRGSQGGSRAASFRCPPPLTFPRGPCGPRGEGSAVGIGQTRASRTRVRFRDGRPHR